jgi:hypothetical protein
MRTFFRPDLYPRMESHMRSSMTRVAAHHGDASSSAPTEEAFTPTSISDQGRIPAQGGSHSLGGLALRRASGFCLLAMFLAGCSSESDQRLATVRSGSSTTGSCVDYSDDPAGCQPSTFDTPIGQMPSVRVDAGGQLDPFSSESDARAGFSKLETELNLFRNFERLHWVLTVPSERDPGTGGWRGGDLEGAGDARGLGIAGECLYVGHANGPGATHAINIFKIQSDPATMPPVQVGEIPAMAIGNQGFDDRELRSLVYTTSAGEDRQILVRNAGTRTVGILQTYEVDMDTCLPIRESETYDFSGPSHEFFLWHDPENSNRILVYVAMFSGGGLPDPSDPTLGIPDGIVLAVTDEDTGEMLQHPSVLAGFSLQDVGGPPINERADETGLFGDGRFADFSASTNRSDRPGNNQDRQNNMLHSVSVSDDGERVYVAGGNAGFYVLNSTGVAENRNDDLAAGRAGCNLRSTVVSDRGAVDPTRLREVARDCLHMVVNDDPGLEAFLASNASDAAKAARYLVLMTRSRIDVHPPFSSLPTGIHSAVFVPERPAQVRGNTDGRPAYVWLSDENGGCPLMHARIVSVESETTPVMVGAFAIPDNQMGECLTQANTEPNGEPRRRVPQQNHNPTVFRNLVFTSWYGHGLRAIDISNPYNPREVGYALTLPHGVTRSYPVFKDGLIYWTDSDTGLRVARYTGPRSGELPGSGSGTYESNATSPHR